MTSENVLANWPAEMSHSRYGECDFDPERVNETSGSEQPAGRADCVESGGRVDGSKSAPHQAHPGGLPGERPGGPGPRAPRKQTGQRHTCGSDRRRSALGQHPIRWSQPHPSERTAQRTRGYRHRPDHPAAHPGQRRAEQSTAKASAQTPGTPPAHASGGHAGTDGRQSSPVVGEPAISFRTAAGRGRCHRYGGRHPLFRAGRRPQLLRADAGFGAVSRRTRPSTPTGTGSSNTRLDPVWMARRPSSAGPWTSSGYR